MSDYSDMPETAESPLRSFRRSLTRRVFTRFVVAIVVYTIFILFGLFTSVFVCASISWDYYSPLYRILNWISDYLPLVLIVVFVIGYLAIFMHYWSRTLGYLENIVSATEQIYRSGDDPISLPEDLREVEIQMNRIKADMLASRLAAREAEQRKTTWWCIWLTT